MPQKKSTVSSLRRQTAKGSGASSLNRGNRSRSTNPESRSTPGGRTSERTSSSPRRDDSPSRSRSSSGEFRQDWRPSDDRDNRSFSRDSGRGSDRGDWGPRESFDRPSYRADDRFRSVNDRPPSDSPYRESRSPFDSRNERLYRPNTVRSARDFDDRFERDRYAGSSRPDDYYRAGPDYREKQVRQDWDRPAYADDDRDRRSAQERDDYYDRQGRGAQPFPSGGRRRDYPEESGRFARHESIRQDEDYEERGDDYIAREASFRGDDDRYYAGRGVRQENESRGSGRSRSGTSRSSTAGSRSRSRSRA